MTGAFLATTKEVGTKVGTSMGLQVTSDQSASIDNFDVQYYIIWPCRNSLDDHPDHAIVDSVNRQMSCSSSGTLEHNVPVRM